MSLLAVSPDSAYWSCSLLKVEGISILLDAGLPAPGGVESDPAVLYRPLLPYLKEISFVLITHGDAAHIGGLPWLYTKAGLTATTILTGPVKSLGEAACIDRLEADAKYSPDGSAVDTEDIVGCFLNDVWFQEVGVVCYLWARPLGRYRSSAGGNTPPAFPPRHIPSLLFDQKSGKSRFLIFL